MKRLMAVMDDVNEVRWCISASYEAVNHDLPPSNSHMSSAKEVQVVKIRKFITYFRELISLKCTIT
jgi:hypothetical protein